MSDPGKKGGCGCIGKGCIVMAILAAVFAGLLVWGVNRVATKLRALASGSAVETPAENGTRDEYEALVKKLDAFKDAAPGSGKTLELNAHDLNLLIAFSPELEMVRGKIHAAVDKGEIGVAGSMPLGVMSSPGRLYLNGGIYFTLSMEDKVLRVSVRTIKLTDHDLSSGDEKEFSVFWTACLTNNMLPVFGPVLLKAKTLKVNEGVIELTSG
jgi:hypothetical protein